MNKFQKDFVRKGYSIIKPKSIKEINKLHKFIVLNLKKKNLKKISNNLSKLNKYLSKETFLMTYGDGLSNVNLKKLVKFHKQKKKIITLTAVRPPARFGAIKITSKNNVKYFKEKSSIDEGWINGGFFVIEPEIFKYLKNDSTYLERSPLEKIASLGNLVAFKHYGFWQCMDTLRDKEILEKKIKKKR